MPGCFFSSAQGKSGPQQKPRAEQHTQEIRRQALQEKIVWPIVFGQSEAKSTAHCFTDHETIAATCIRRSLRDHGRRMPL